MPLVERHPESGLSMLYENGAWRVLGCLTPHPRCALPAWGDAPGQVTLPPAQWRDINLHEQWADVPTWNQARSSSCVGHALESSFSYAWLASGGTPRRFSPTWVYGLINGGADRGAVVSDALTAVKMYGICEAALVPEGMLFRQQFPAEAYANARRFRAVEAYQLRTFDDICSALSTGLTCLSGIYIGKNFGQLDSDGVAPLPDTVVGGHALPHIGLKFSKTRNDWLVLTQNSWGPEWGMQDHGQGGFCYLTRQHWDHIYVDAWAIAGCYRDPEDAASVLPDPTGVEA